MTIRSSGTECSTRTMTSRKISNATWFVAGFIITVAVTATAIFLTPKLFSHQDDTYNSFSFSKSSCTASKQDCWYTALEIRNVPYTVTFYYHPRDVENISVARDTLKVPLLVNVTNHTLYVVVPEEAPGSIGIAAVELSRILGKRYGIFDLNVKGAVYGTTEGQVSCADANNRTVVLLFEQAPVDSVFIRNRNCIVLAAVDADRAVAVADAYAYRLLGIIPTYALPQNLLTTKLTNDTLLR